MPSVESSSDYCICLFQMENNKTLTCFLVSFRTERELNELNGQQKKNNTRSSP